MTTIPQFELAMKALSAKFSGELPHKLAEIHQLYLAVTQNVQDDATLNRLYRTLHGLAGAARTFGYPHISVAAQRLEQCVADVMQAAKPHSIPIAPLQVAMEEFQSTCLEQKAA